MSEWNDRVDIYAPVSDPASSGVYETTDDPTGTHSRAGLYLYQLFDGKGWYGSSATPEGAAAYAADYPHRVWGPRYWRPDRLAAERAELRVVDNCLATLQRRRDALLRALGGPR